SGRKLRMTKPAQLSCWRMTVCTSSGDHTRKQPSGCVTCNTMVETESGYEPTLSARIGQPRGERRVRAHLSEASALREHESFDQILQAHDFLPYCFIRIGDLFERSQHALFVRSLSFAVLQPRAADF